MLTHHPKSAPCMLLSETASRVLHLSMASLCSSFDFSIIN